MLNFYNLVKEKKKVHNPNFKNHHIEIPFRILITGASGSMKTNSCLNVIRVMNNTFSLIYVCCKMKNEPLYNYLEDKCGDSIIFFENGDLPNIDELQFDENVLIIFDDLINCKQNGILEFFIRGRKKNISCIYISQSYYKTPKPIRNQCGYFIFKKLNNKKEISCILSEMPFDINFKEFNNLGDVDFLLIDTITRNNKFKIRINFG